MDAWRDHRGKLRDWKDYIDARGVSRVREGRCTQRKWSKVRATGVYCWKNSKRR